MELNRISLQGYNNLLVSIRDFEQHHGYLTEDAINILGGKKAFAFLSERGYLKEISPDGKYVLSEKATPSQDDSNIFDNVFGWKEYKARVLKAVSDPKRGYVALLYGASRVGKTEFFSALDKIKSKPAIHMSLDPKEMSVRGMVEKLKDVYESVGSSDFIIIFDEIDKCPMDIQRSPTVLRLFDSDSNRALFYNKMTPDGKANFLNISLRYTKIFAAANDIAKVDRTLLNRFDLMPFPEYDHDRFVETAMELLMVKYKEDRELAFRKAGYFWDHGRNMGDVDASGGRFSSIKDFEDWASFRDKNAYLVKTTRDGSWSRI